jgi:hypothetical protein
MSTLFRRDLPLAMMFILAVILIIDYYFPVPIAGEIGATTLSWASLIVTFALGMGAVNMNRMHIRNIVDRTPGRWDLSVVWMFVFLSMMAIGLGLGVTSSTFVTIYNNNAIVITQAAYSCLAFMIISGAYRAFRARTLEATLLLLTALAVMMGNITIGGVIWQGFLPIRNFVMAIFTTSVQRGIAITAACGLVVVCLRTILGWEKGISAEVTGA